MEKLIVKYYIIGFICIVGNYLFKSYQSLDPSSIRYYDNVDWIIYSIIPIFSVLLYISGSIYFYESLKSKNMYLKIGFSFINSLIIGIILNLLNVFLILNP